MSNRAVDLDWSIFDTGTLLDKVAGAEPRIFEFLRVPSLSVSIYRLPVGCKDMQAPHLEDEVYYVVEGRARLKVEENEHTIGPGSILLVRATQNHSFFDIEEDLVVLAFFGSQKPRY